MDFLNMEESVDCTFDFYNWKVIPFRERNSLTVFGYKVSITF